jgi:hypothetical protein
MRIREQIPIINRTIDSSLTNTLLLLMAGFCLVLNIILSIKAVTACKNLQEVSYIYSGCGLSLTITESPWIAAVIPPSKSRIASIT